MRYYTIIVEHLEDGEMRVSRWHEKYDSLATAQTRAREFAMNLDGKVLRVSTAYHTM